MDSSGHRERLRQRFMRSPERSLDDYELLELLLFYVFKRSDTKPIAKALLRRFGSLGDVINASASELSTVHGVGPSVILKFKLLRDLYSRLLLPTECEKPIISSWPSVVSYCRWTMAFKRVECWRVLYLDTANKIVLDQLSEEGDADQIFISTTDIAKKALQVSAKAIVLVHNHPVGDASPSDDDINTTKALKDALNLIGITLFDHIIITKDSVYSFKQNEVL